MSDYHTKVKTYSMELTAYQAYVLTNIIESGYISCYENSTISDVAVKALERRGGE